MAMIILFSILLPIVLWAGFAKALKGQVYEMDPAGHKFMFPLVWVPYRISYWALFSLGLPAAFLLTGLRIGHGLGFMFLMSAICSLLFNLLLNLFYESYIASKYTMTGPMKSDYTATKYGLILSLGTSSLILFVFGMLLAFVAVSQL